MLLYTMNGAIENLVYVTLVAAVTRGDFAFADNPLLIVIIAAYLFWHCDAWARLRKLLRRAHTQKIIIWDAEQNTVGIGNHHNHAYYALAAHIGALAARQRKRITYTCDECDNDATMTPAIYECEPIVHNGIKFKFASRLVKQQITGAVRTTYSVSLSGRPLEELYAWVRARTAEYIVEQQRARYQILTMYNLLTYTWAARGWVANHTNLHKRWDNLWIDNELIRAIKCDIKRLFENDAHYMLHGCPRKLAYLLHGKPGCGKTSLYLTIAIENQLPIYYVNSPADLANIDSNQTACVIVFEELDTYDVTRPRANTDNTTRVSKPEPCAEPTQAFFNAILRFLDGYHSIPEKCIIIATTNYIARLDPAIVRSGRFDRVIELNNAPATAIDKMIKYYYNRVASPHALALAGRVPTCDLVNAIAQADGYKSAMRRWDELAAAADSTNTVSSTTQSPALDYTPLIIGAGTDTA